tara:strand:- start:133 stop:909 length:777 start_codon:yes stop_codon:yes gene_type:complete
MCLIALSIKKETDWSGKESYFFTLVANRDEYHDRPTSQLNWWKDKEILAGKDELAGGTWLGVSKSGRFAALTNYKENTQKKFKLSRGFLVTDFLESKKSAKSYLENLNGKDYAGFNLIVGDRNGLFYFCNRSEGIYLLPEGVHALGNLTLNNNTAKIDLVKMDLEELFISEFKTQSALDMMKKEFGKLHEKSKEELIPKEWVEIPYRFIRSKIYGTRCTSICRMLSSGEVEFCEQSYSEEGVEGGRREFTFNIKSLDS